MLPCPLVCMCSAAKRQVIALRTSGSKEDLLILHLQKLRKCFFCFFYILLCLDSLGMHGRRIAVILAHDLPDDIAYALISHRRRRVI